MTPNAQVTATLAAYVPRGLPAGAWTLAAAPVRSLAARTAPHDPARARGVAWALCVLLAGPYGWDRQAAPDLRALLTPAAIQAVLDVHVAGGGRSADHLARHLTQARRTAHALPARSRRTHRMPAITRTSTCETSVVEVARALTSAGRPVTRSTLGAFAAEAAASTARGRAARTLELTYTARILQATDERSTEAVHATPTHATRHTTPARTSMRAERAARKAERDTLRRATSGPVLAPEPDPARLPADVRDALDDYYPRGVPGRLWAELRPLTMRLVIGSNPATVNIARTRATAAVGYLRWLHAQPTGPANPGPLSAADLVDLDLLEAYITHRRRTSGASTASISSTRSLLRALVAALDAQPLAVPASYTPLRGPYSPAQCEDLLELVANQPSRARQRTGALVVGLALGAGLAARDLRYVRACDIVERDTDTLFPYLTVTVPAGPAPRTVIIRDAYAPAVRTGLALHEGAETDLLIGRLEGRKNVTTLRLTTADGTPVKLDIARLRTTWLFAMIHVAIPLPRLLADAGLTTAATLADLLPYARHVEPDIALTRTAPDITPTTSERAARSTEVAR